MSISRRMTEAAHSMALRRRSKRATVHHQWVEVEKVLQCEGASELARYLITARELQARGALQLETCSQGRDIRIAVCVSPGGASVLRKG